MAVHTAMVELLPRYAFLEALIRGARVLEIGALEGAGGKSAVLLHDRGAASVVSVGEGAARAQSRHGGPGLTFRNGGIGSLPQASFDLLLVHDASFVNQPQAVEGLAKLLAPGGRLLVALRAQGPSLCHGGPPPAAGADAYRGLLESLRPSFPSIEVASQQSLIGWVVAPAGVTDPALEVDTSFAAPEIPAFYLFLCGSEGSGLRHQSLVPLEVARHLGERGPGSELVEQRTRVEQLLRELRHARELVRERESWIEGLRHEVDELHRRGEEQAGELAAAKVRLVKLDREYEAASGSLARVREQLVARARELEGARRALAVRTEDLKLAEEEQEALRATIQTLGAGKVEAEAALERLRAAGPASSGSEGAAGASAIPEASGTSEASAAGASEASAAGASEASGPRVSEASEALEALRIRLAEALATNEVLRLERELALEAPVDTPPEVEALRVQLMEAHATNEVLGLERTRWLEDRKLLQSKTEEAESQARQLAATLASIEEADGSVTVAAVQAERDRAQAELQSLLQQGARLGGAAGGLAGTDAAGGPGAAHGAGPAPRFEEDARRIRELEDRLDAASSRAREIEDRMRAAERRAELAESARAEGLATARRWQLEAETARRDAAGVAAGMADRESLKSERDEALARAAEEAGRRAAIKNQLQAEAQRAAAAEAELQRLQRELESLRQERGAMGQRG